MTTDTSEEAFESIKPTRAQKLVTVENFIRNRGDQGATCDEVQEWCVMLAQTASARCNELLKTHRIHDSGKRRKTRNGRNARVYRFGPSPVDAAQKGLFE